MAPAALRGHNSLISRILSPKIASKEVVFLNTQGN